MQRPEIDKVDMDSIDQLSRAPGQLPLGRLDPLMIMYIVGMSSLWIMKISSTIIMINVL